MRHHLYHGILEECFEVSALPALLSPPAEDSDSSFSGFDVVIDEISGKPLIEFQALSDRASYTLMRRSEYERDYGALIQLSYRTQGVEYQDDSAKEGVSYTYYLAVRDAVTGSEITQSAKFFVIPCAPNGEIDFEWQDPAA